MPKSKSKPSVAERIAAKLFKSLHRDQSPPTHLAIVRYPGNFIHGNWTRAGVIALIKSELKKETARHAK